MEGRQLRPIYDALELPDTKYALNECDKLLRKHPNHYGAQALKTFILARSGRPNEALLLGQSVLSTPSAMASAHVQQGLSLAFRALGCPREEIMVYTAALAFSPNDESLHTKVFMAAARNSMFKEQHHAAVQLSKLSKQQKYVWWLVVSLLLQAKHSKDDVAAPVQLKLAERLVEKAVTDGQLTSTEELRVYLDVLDIQDKHEQMTEVMAANGQLAAMISNDPDLVTQRISLLIKIGAYDKAISAAIAALESRDNWADYKLYIGAVVALVGQAADVEAKHSLAADISSNFEKWAGVRGKARGAKLAQVALATRMHEAGHGDIAGSPEVLIWSYLAEFQQKAICYSDIMQFIVARREPSVLEYHRTQLEQRLAAARDSAANSDDAAQAWVNLEKIRYLLQALMGETDPKAWAADIEPLLKFGLGSSQARKKQPSCSDMALIASQRIIQAAFFAYSAANQREQLHSALFKALCVLESGIQLNDSSFLLKLYAIRVYLYLSCYERAQTIYDTLSIKHVQQDTLGHLIIGHGMALGCFASDMEFCYNGVTFYDRFRSKMPRDIEAVYQQGTYSNVQDFLEFQSNIVHSVQRECTHRYALRGEGFEYGNAKETLARWEEADVSSIEHTEQTLSALHDNRDVLVMGLLTPKDMAQWDLELLTRSTPMPGHDWIQAFSLIPQVMHYLVCADNESLQEKLSELTLVDNTSGTLSRQDVLLVRGIIDVGSLYIQASDLQNGIDDQLGRLLSVIRTNVPSNELEPSLFSLSSDSIRNLSAATELFTYMLALKHALSAQRLPAANAVGIALSQLRKEALKSVNALRGWVDKNTRALVEEQWLAENDGDIFADVTRFVVGSQKQTTSMVAKACTTSWLRSVKNLLSQWEKCS
ncbi:mitochondrial distribution and morphology [Coemansia sp. RSA 1822]|nr:mitochondrial distribution and morphology [Coemansia sp. RSA 638]KAJ2542090.1 mitochondrial distribution and morphology [Coemansia sp. RSA 1853]KAJ2561634.1 mitochondrial distribution and morphology [Coemansia sp. RSA 1822]